MENRHLPHMEDCVFRGQEESFIGVRKVQWPSEFMGFWALDESGLSPQNLSGPLRLLELLSPALHHLKELSAVLEMLRLHCPASNHVASDLTSAPPPHTALHLSFKFPIL